MSLEEIKSGRRVFEVVEVKKLQPMKRMQWTKTFDAYLLLLVGCDGSINWKQIAHAMSLKFPDMEFTSKKCRARWKNSLNPDLHKLYLNNAEELLVLAYHSLYQNQWTKISYYLPHRHSNLLRNTFHSMIKKLVKHILNTRALPLEITPLFFLQSLYTISYILHLLHLQQSPTTKNFLAPLYVYRYVHESGINEDACKELVMRVKDQLVRQNSFCMKLQALRTLPYKNLVEDFLKHVINAIKNSVTAQMHITDEFILELIEHSLLSISSHSPIVYSLVTPMPPLPLLQLGLIPCTLRCYLSLIHISEPTRPY
eukprot:TRINITY_DN7931_c0_g1_i10.p1 TRINITY_DN7931_c0_g1~~TRINITY_DN7931_c0_g1_i10.p1  ORF type:complete len:312 (-),score=11.04 TRINITY_DN7931_c0_g1_i10:48-983(-)